MSISFSAFVDELEKLAYCLPTGLAKSKLAFNTEGFKEGLLDEGIPLAGATAGAYLGKGLRGAALGYAAGSGISLLRSKLKGEKPSTARKLLALSGAGYGAGGLLHGALERHAINVAKKTGKASRFFHTGGPMTRMHYGIEEAIPAAGATLGAGLAMSTEPSEKKKGRPE